MEKSIAITIHTVYCPGCVFELFPESIGGYEYENIIQENTFRDKVIKFTEKMSNYGKIDCCYDLYRFIVFSCIKFGVWINVRNELLVVEIIFIFSI